MASLAEDLAYYLVNPSAPYFVEAVKVYNFYGLGGFYEFLVEANLNNHPDILALPFNGAWDAALIWNQVKNVAFYGVTFREITNVDPCNPCEKFYLAVKPV